MNSLILALGAILLWSTLALFGSSLTTVPSFLLLGVAFTISGLPSLVRRRAWKIPATTLLVGVAGIFGYHFLYFRAFAGAPAVEANLLNYLWPLLIVLLSPVILSGYRLHAQHVLGGVLGLAGAITLISHGKLNLDSQYLPGYLLAAGAAVVWALYSLMTRRVPKFPTDSVGAFCFVSALLSYAAFFVFGGTWAQVQQLAPGRWVELVLLGLGPMGSAFYLWDAALKNGDPRSIGAFAYLTPLLSTCNLVLFGGQLLSWTAALAMIFIISGAVIGNLPVKGDVKTGARSASPDD